MIAENFICNLIYDLLAGIINVSEAVKDCVFVHLI